MRVNYEEKTYESYFNTELNKKSRIYFPIGQVQEGYLGFDSSAYSKNKKLWEWLGYTGVLSLPFKGLELREIASEIESLLKVKINNMPKMEANLLFQYKKPQYITTSLGKEWGEWSQPYYRYNIYKEQQKLLIHIHSKLGDKVLVILCISCFAQC